MEIFLSAMKSLSCPSVAASRFAAQAFPFPSGLSHVLTWRASADGVRVGMGCALHSSALGSCNPAAIRHPSCWEENVCCAVCSPSLVYGVQGGFQMNHCFSSQPEFLLLPSPLSSPAGDIPAWLCLFSSGRGWLSKS